MGAWWSYIPLIGSFVERLQDNNRLRLENEHKRLELERLRAEHAKCPVPVHEVSKPKG